MNRDAFFDELLPTKLIEGDEAYASQVHFRDSVDRYYQGIMLSYDENGMFVYLTWEHEDFPYQEDEVYFFSFRHVYYLSVLQLSLCQRKIAWAKYLEISLQ